MNKEYTRAPHRRGPENGSPNAALLIDFDNVTMGIRSNLGHELRSLLDSDIIHGKVAVQRAYADWRRYPQYIVPLSESAIDLIFAPAYGSSKKNATDIRLAIDALELVFTRPEIGTFILLSGDSDFSSLVLKLKEYGKYVIGVGMQESSSDILVQNCDEYYSYNSLSGLTSAADMTSQKLDPWELTERALDRMVQRSDVMRSDRLKQVMLELDPGFDEKAAGYSKFNRFLAEAAHRGIVSLRKAGDGQYEVSPSGKAPTPEEKPRTSTGGREASRSRGRRGDGGRRERREEARAEPAAPPAAEPAAATNGAEAAPAEAGSDAAALRRAYDLLREAVANLTPDEEGRVRDSEVKRKILSRDGQFDETTLGFRKFSRFLQQAHDEGVVDLTQGEDGNYYLSPTDGAPAATRDRRRADTAREADGAGASATKAAERDSERRRDSQRRRESQRAEERERAEDAEEPDDAAVAAASAADAASREREPEASREEASGGADRGRSRGRRGRGLGRFRRGSRGRPEPGTAEGGAPHIGPVDVAETSQETGVESKAPADSAESKAPEEPSAREPAAREPEGGPSAGEPSTTAAGGAAAGGESGERRASGARRGLGRYRRGSRGASPGAGKASTTSSSGGPDATDGAAAPSGEASPAPEPGGREAEAIEHMIRNYPGVGRKTAERLVEEFGGEVFRVMDSQPSRISQVLSDHRAQAVLEAREAERREA